MNRTRFKPLNKSYKIQVYNVPEEWVEYLSRESDKLGISVSDYVKVFILEPWFKNRKVMEVEANEGS